MVGEQTVYLVALVLGIAGGVVGWRLPPSGRNAVLLGLIPLSGLLLGMTFC
jgi:hypothetical protein